MSGHIFIKDDFYGFDDALYVAIRVLSQMAKTGETITDFIDRLATQYATPELRFECDDSEKFGIVELITLYAKEHFPDYNLTLIDGVRVRNDDGWWLVRASNTEAALVVRAEARSEASLSKLTQDIRAALNFAGQTVGSDFFQQSSNF